MSHCCQNKKCCSSKNSQSINFCLLKSYLEDVRGWKNVVEPCSHKRKPKPEPEQNNECLSIVVKKKDSESEKDIMNINL